MNTYQTYHNYDFSFFPIRAFKVETGQADAGLPEPSLKVDEEASREKAIICRACGNVITKPDQIIEIEGKSAHKFVNPAGIIYRIGCFKTAAGCAVAGEPTREFTWFPGYSWRFALCAMCLAHLGWHYTSGESGFFGLILDKITENIT